MLLSWDVELGLKVNTNSKPAYDFDVSPLSC